MCSLSLSLSLSPGDLTSLSELLYALIAQLPQIFLLEGVSLKEKHKIFHPHFKKMKQKLLLIQKA
jgi:hypothetical protein